MKFKKQKRRVRRARKVFKRRLNKGTSLSNTRYGLSHHLPMPPKYFTALEASFTGLLNANVTSMQGSYVIVPSNRAPFAAGSPSSHFTITESGGTPAAATYAGFTQLAGIYQYYRLLAFKVTLEITPDVGITPGNAPITDITQWAMAPFTSTLANAGTAVYSYIFDMRKAPWGKGLNCSGYGADNDKTVRLTSYVKVKDLYGVPASAIMSEDNYAGYSTSAGAQIPDACNVQVSWRTDSADDGGGPYMVANQLIRFSCKGYFCFDNINNTIGS